jgi:N6-adenosine-specific RNA methylase IME4
MSLEELEKLPVGDWAAPDSVLLLWATDPLLDKAFELIRAWGFTYKTVGFYWVKLNKSGRGFFTGLGFWTRANPEPCLLATKGRPKRLASDVAKLVVSPRREHSRKPDEIYERIERLAPGPYLELFARTARPGWDAWGAEVGLFDRGEVPTRRWASNSYPNAAE